MALGASTIITIIVPMYNRATVIHRTLHSIASQQHLDRCRLILVDNNSSDDTRQVAMKWIETEAPRHLECRLIDCLTPGAAAARNAGLAHVDTPWVMHFDSDDVMLPNLLESVFDVIDTNHECNFVSWDMLGDTPRKRGRLIGVIPGRHVMTDAIVHGTTATQRWAATTALVREAGVWNESCMGWNDFELGVRMLALNPGIVHINRVLVKSYLSDNSITESRFSANPDKWQHALDLIADNLANNADALLWVDYRRVILAAEYHREGSRPLARKLLRDTLAKYKKMRRFGFRIVYAKHCIYPRGSHMVARMFLKRNFNHTNSNKIL